MQCNKFIVEHQKKYLDQKIGQIASAGERKKLVKDVLDFSTAN